MISSLLSFIPHGRPCLILAPMQEVTDLSFWKVIHGYGDPDVYFTEYFRVYPGSRPERDILHCIENNPSDRPVLAQMIGNDIPSLEKTALCLQQYPIAGVDLNLGCPAPMVCKKNSGGGLLKYPEEIEAILRALRGVISLAFTVKTRIGFDRPEEFETLLPRLAAHPIDLLTVHGRTVREMYRTAVHYDKIAQAAEAMACPVVANGNVLSVRLARETVERTGAQGLMIGRGAIRNPWIFRQIREAYAKVEALPPSASAYEREVAFEPDFHPRFWDLRHYLEVLWKAIGKPGIAPQKQVAKMKKYLHFIGQGIGGSGSPFLYEIRRSQTEKEFFQISDKYLSSDAFFEPEPPEGALFCSRSQQQEKKEQQEKASVEGSG